MPPASQHRAASDAHLGGGTLPQSHYAGGPDVQLGGTLPPTTQHVPAADVASVKSATDSVAWSLLGASRRRHLYLEVASIVLLFVAGGILNILPPLEQSFNVNDVAIQRPMRAQTIPEWLAGVITILGPAIFILAFKRVRGVRPVIGLLVATGLTLFVTGALKNLVGALRPDFLDRCKPDPKNITVCTGNIADIKEGRRSFPSGHSSVSFAGMVYLSLWIATRLHVFDAGRDEAKGLRLFAAHLPTCGAAAIALTRILDNRHSYLDITAGMLLGTYIAFLCAKVYIKGFAGVTISVAGITSARDLEVLPSHYSGADRDLANGSRAGSRGIVLYVDSRTPAQRMVDSSANLAASSGEIPLRQIHPVHHQ
ncbi:hypothetical protein H9P43_000436 [Blastocladiella emersonii ATCC 22665]|nr:hypothetical protein H9P43_000436 [Blastocladiella emersonii ATCC 22665]